MLHYMTVYWKYDIIGEIVLIVHVMLYYYYDAYELSMRDLICLRRVSVSLLYRVPTALCRGGRTCVACCLF